MIIRYYIDTSVFGGYFDPEFEETTRKFFDQIDKQGIKILYSELTKNELINAPYEVRNYVNLKTGYPTIEIRSPLELIDHEDNS